MRRNILPAAALAIAAPLLQGAQAAAISPTARQVPGRTVEPDRLVADPAYAARMLRELDARPLADRRDAPLLAFRAAALAGLGRREESRAALDRFIAGRAAEPEAYIVASLAALRNRDPERMLTILEAAAANVPPEARAMLHVGLPMYEVAGLGQMFTAPGRESSLDRYYDAMVGLGWPGDMRPASRDAFRLEVVRRRLDRGDREAAARLARTIEAPEPLLELLLIRRYDGLVPEQGDPRAAIRRALERHDRATAAAVAAYPSDALALIERAQHLRGVSRSAEAYALLAPFLRDVPATVASEFQGMWLVNEAVGILQDLGRDDEAIALMERLLALDVARYPPLVGVRINHVEVLRAAGRADLALAHAVRLRAEEAGVYASSYGRQWIDAGIVCALADLGRGTEASPHIERMRGRNDHLRALSYAYLCLNDLDRAAATYVRRLESDEAAQAVRALQVYEIDDGPPRPDPLAERLEAVRTRPEVAAAIERVGRSLRLPLSDHYWGVY